MREVTAKAPQDLDAKLARVLVLKRDFDGARAALESTLRHDPPHVPSLFLFAALAQSPSQVKAGLAALARVDNSRYLPTVKSAEFAFARANLTALSGDPARAEAVLAGAANSTSISPPLALALANASLAAHRARFAEWLLSRASETRGAPVAVHEALAELALSEHHLSTARAAISKLRTDSKPDPKALMLLADLQGLKNEPAERIKAMRRALAAVPPKDDALRRNVTVALATALEQSGQAQEAATVLADLLQRYPGFPPAALLLAKVSLAQKQPDRAIRLAGALVEQPYFRTDAYRILVSAYALKQAPAEAEAAARRFVASSSGSADSTALLANLFIEKNQPELALREVEAGLSRHPGSVELLAAHVKLTERVRGFAKAEAVALAAARGKNRPDQALSACGDLAAVEPAVLAQLSVLQDRMGRPEDALASMRRLTQTAPYDTQARLRLGALEERAGQLDAARRAYEWVLTLDPDSVPALNNLAVLLAGAFKDPKRAVALARRAHALRPDDQRVTDTLGWALARSQEAGARSEAVLLLKQSSTGLATPESLYHYAAALSATGEYADAKEALDGPSAGAWPPTE